jgi:hypothetical protein
VQIEGMTAIVSTHDTLGLSRSGPRAHEHELPSACGQLSGDLAELADLDPHLDSTVERLRRSMRDGLGGRCADRLQLPDHDGRALRGAVGPRHRLPGDGLSVKVREGRRVVNIAVMVATGVNADGHREILGIDASTAEDSAGWLTFFRDVTARGLTGVTLVTSDAHSGLVAATGATLPGASWQRCRTHDAANLMSVCPKSSWPWVKTMLHSVDDQVDADSVHAQFDRLHSRTPTSCTSAPTAPRSSDSSKRSSPSSTTNGPKDAATSPWRSSAAHD